MPPVTRLRNKKGDVLDVDEEHLPGALASGYAPETAEQDASRVQGDVTHDTYGGVGGAVAAGTLGLARGATLGLSDAALSAIGGEDTEHSLAGYRNENPITSGVTQIAGMLAPALLTGGAAGADAAELAGLSPSGFISNIGAKVAEQGTGTLGRIGATAAGGALEGAAQTAGSYVSDVALGDRDLSAEGFLGAMGKGALYGGVAGGALSVASHGMIAARSMFPAEELTADGVRAAKFGAQKAIGDSVDVSKGLEQTGQTAVTQTDRETARFIDDLEKERASALDQAAKQRTAEEAAKASAPAEPGYDPMAMLEKYRTDAPPTVPGEEPLPIVKGPAEAPQGEPVPWTPPKDAKQLMAAWRDKYPSGAVDLDVANAAARRQRMSEWAENFEPKTPEDATIKDYFSNPRNPMSTDVRVGMPDAPKAVQTVARQAAAEASHEAYIEATAQGANVSKSGPELMARATYAARKAAAQKMDDVYAAYAAGKPIVDIRAAATQKLSGQLHELAEARADMLQSLAQKPAADDLMAQLQGTKAGLDTGQPLSLGQRILQGVEKPIDPDSAVASALEKSKDVNSDIADVAPKITRYEAAKASLTEALGPKASPDAVAHAQAFRQAQQQAANTNARTAAEAADNIDKTIRGVPTEALPKGKSIIGGLAKRASDAGAAYETLRMMGVPLPDPKSIPVIGPILSAYLKAKVIGKVAGKFGGSFAATAEGTIAAKAVTTRNRIVAAVGTMVDKGANRLIVAAPDIGAGAALGFKLFEDGKKTPYSSEPAKGDTPELFNQRLGELTAAMKPGAIQQAVEARINTTDPTIRDAIITAETCRLQYLYNQAPKLSGPPLPGQPQRDPSRTQMLEFGIILAAHHDPAAVFERVANGGVARPSEIAYLNNCTPQLMKAAQAKLVDTLSKAESSLPYNRRVSVSSLLGIPMDATMQPSHMALLQQGIPQPTQPTPVTPPHPTLTSSIGIGDRTLTRLDQ